MYGRGPRIGWRLLAWWLLTAQRRRRARRLGARFVAFIIPDKMSIYGDLALDRDRYPRANSPASRIGRLLSDRMREDVWIDAQSEFERATGRGLLYMKTDTHWTTEGYLLGYELLCRHCGAQPEAHVLSGPVERADGFLDTGSKCRPPVPGVVETHGFERLARRVEQNDLVSFQETLTTSVPGSSVGSRVVLSNDAPGVDPRRIVMFGDSYTFHHSGLGAMLAETFREVHLVWSSRIDWDYVGRCRPDVVVHEIAERFIWRVPVDSFSVDRFASARVAKLRRRPDTGTA